MQPPTTTRKRKEVTKDVSAVLKYLENKNKDKSHKKLDHTDHLFLSYAHTFKKFSPITQALLKMELSRLFERAELSEFDAHTSTQSSPMFSTKSSWSDDYSNGAVNTTGSIMESPNYSNQQIKTNPINLSGTYPNTQMTRDLYEDVTISSLVQTRIMYSKKY